jgi:hypothetical protein
VGHQQPFGLVFVVHADDDGHWSPVARNHNRTGFARLEEIAKP